MSFFDWFERKFFTNEVINKITSFVIIVTIIYNTILIIRWLVTK